MDGFFFFFKFKALPPSLLSPALFSDLINNWTLEGESSYIPSFFFFLLCFSGISLQHMEIPRPGVESKLQLLLAYTTVIATPDP